jgi:ATP-dependent RNA helicase DeaD
LLAEYSHSNDVSPEEIASALAFLLQKERPLQVKFTDVKPDRNTGSRDERGSRERSDRGPRDRNDRGPRSDRGNREDRGGREDRPRREHANDDNMQRYRIEVGRNHEARPGDIVGAIANEAGISSSNIGHIKLHDEFSTVDLPKGLAPDLLNQLKKVRVRNRPLDITVDGSHSGSGSGSGKRDFPEKRSYSDKPKRDDDAPRGKLSLGGAAKDKPKIRERDQKNKGYRPKKTD